ncbi:hypothetical protein MUK51_08830 [Sphingobacterium faecium]|uniref:hypothetical protein n=1 Tax=Sphingobacterium faecium TaxID=34087 RepID=UPI0021B608CA|nr:hypothetical protein [Sphingobacterium faecium]UXD71385.1 hypothetical protein MUK51_08830 [Sphingobacterium faecium]
MEKLFGSSQFYSSHGYEGIIKNVGYYHNLENNELIFMLPKVFMEDEKKTVFNLTIDELIYCINDTSVVTDVKLSWVRNLTVFFYKSLVKFKLKFPDSALINYSPVFQLKGIQKTVQYSYLDIVLSFVAYFKKNKNIVLYKHIDAVHANPKKPKWEKTVRKGKPILIGDTLIYDRIRTKNKINNNDEQLIVFYFSILNYFSEQHGLGLNIDKIYPILKGKRFLDLMKQGVRKLKKIKYRYFNDSLKEMHTLCMLFFSSHDQGRGKMREDFITVNNYNIVFEDMIDRLFSDDLESISVNKNSLNDLKYHRDGKILDHIFDHTSLLDSSSIFYIGDSKYYKSGTEAGQNSRFKQFTYAKNVIQYNIDLLNENNRPYKAGQKYRDELTEGYNITPNFFIYGFINCPDDYKSSKLKPQGEVQESYHFKHRLFDRDTLFVHQYKINFLFVLKAYVTYNAIALSTFRSQVRELFRDEFVHYLSKEGKSKYSFYEYVDSPESMIDFVNENFRTLNGKMYKTVDRKLLLAVHEDDKNLKFDDLLSRFTLIDINHLAENKT